MKVGYPCINLSLDCRAGRTFRLRSYSEERLRQTVQGNLDCLDRILRYNLQHGLLFFRITSDLVPFASHPIHRFDWRAYFRDQFTEIGSFIKRHQMRISMHPDPFTLLNSPVSRVLDNSLAELAYHAAVLDELRLDETAKIQIHIGGVYGDKSASAQRFVERYRRLDDRIRRRLVIENDERHYSLRDCLNIHEKTGVPVLFDAFHHAVYAHGETLAEALSAAAKTWRPADGVLMVDYSSQKPQARGGRHAESLDTCDFRAFLRASRPYDFDLMLEIKDKEVSALKALEIVAEATAAGEGLKNPRPASIAEKRLP
jgi:UV DNA damage endonuclease